jgi:hypothetical protein
MKYFLIEMIDPDNPVILNENPGSNKPLILTGDKDELKKQLLENTHKGMLVPITFNILDLMEDLYNFIFINKDICGEDIDIGKSGIENGVDCLETRVSDFLNFNK